MDGGRVGGQGSEVRGAVYKALGWRGGGGGGGTGPGGGLGTESEQRA